VTPISLGIFASANQSAAATSYESIATVTGTGSSATITFSSIPSTYTHLQVRCISRSTAGSAGGSGIQVTANSDSTSGNYSFHRLMGDGTSAAAYGQSGLDYILLNSNSANTSGMYAVSIIDILDYTNTNKGKTFRALTGLELNNTLGVVGVRSQGYFATPAAITSLSFTTSVGNHDTNTTFALYGIKGAA
jgi:hypothetical protein